MVISVAVPWSLSHYIPLNGFHPLYRALFDLAPSDLRLVAWDNVHLQSAVREDRKVKKKILQMVEKIKQEQNQLNPMSISGRRGEYVTAGDSALLRLLPGDIEFLHTSPFPSLTRPFVFHCEAFSPVFFPDMHSGVDNTKGLPAYRDYFSNIFSSPLCLGIFSHVPETLENFRKFFRSPIISQKLFECPIGLVDNPTDSKNSTSKMGGGPTFLFINSAHQKPENFINRGGHIVLKFWQNFIAAGCRGQLVLRCGRPSDESLSVNGVDVAFVNAEIGRSIIWQDKYIAYDDLNKLLKESNFFLLPSRSLHSASILQAMSAGAIPIVTDTVGTSVYVKDGVNGIVLRGMRDAQWREDPSTGILFDRYEEDMTLDNILVSQMMDRVSKLMSFSHEIPRMQSAVVNIYCEKFSGSRFSRTFWGRTSELFDRFNAEHPMYARSHSSDLPQNLYLEAGCWGRKFESVPQPVCRQDSKSYKVFELGGDFVHTNYPGEIELHHWSALSNELDPFSPELEFRRDFKESYDGLRRVEKSHASKFFCNVIERVRAIIGFFFKNFF